MFTGHGLERFNASAAPRAAAAGSPRAKPTLLFSDLNQWMLKILVGQTLPKSSMRVPRGDFRNASQLAAAADVSIMSAVRFVRRLEDEGFRDERKGCIKLVRIEELFERWVTANREAYAQFPAHWIMERSREQLYAALAEFSGEGNDLSPPRHAAPTALFEPRSAAAWVSLEQPMRLDSDSFGECRPISGWRDWIPMC